MEQNRHAIDEHYLRLWVDLGLREIEAFLVAAARGGDDAPSGLDGRPAGA